MFVASVYNIIDDISCMYKFIVHTAIAHLTTCIANTRTLTHVWIIISLHEVNQPQRTCDNSFTIST